MLFCFRFRFCFILSLLICSFGIQAQIQSIIEIDQWIDKEESVQSVDNQFVLIDFWATWCMPCLQAHPHVSRLQQANKDRLQVIGLSSEPTSKLYKFLEKHTLSFPIARDRNEYTFKKFNISSIPESILLSPNGEEIWRGHPADLNQNRLTSFFKKYAFQKGRKGKIRVWSQALLDEGSDQYVIDNGEDVNIINNNIIVKSLDHEQAFKVSFEEGSLLISGQMHELWSYLSCVAPPQYDCKNDACKSYYEIRIEGLPFTDITLEYVAHYLLAYLKVGLETKTRKMNSIELSINEAQKLWSSDVFSFSGQSSLSTFMYGEDFFEGDNMSLKRLAYNLSKGQLQLFTSKLDDPQFFDWSLETRSLKDLRKQLLKEYGVKSKEVKVKRKFYLLN